VSRVARWLLRASVASLLLVIAASASVYWLSERRLTRQHSVSVHVPEIPDADPARARGRFLVRAVVQCDLCHGADLSGSLVADDPGIGTLWAPNLTRGQGGTADLDAADWVRAIRHGLDRNGRPLVLMPAQHLRRLTDADLAAILAYVRTMPPVDRRGPARRIGWKTRIAMVAGMAPGLIASEEMEPGTLLPPPPVDRTAEYGAYLVELAGCRLCHHESLAGGPHPLALPGEAPAPNLTPAGPLRTLGEAQFIAMLRSGVTPDGRTLDASRMPWPAIAQLGDVELGAIFLYLRSLPPRATGVLRQ
jgi:mono/diheme cytochrome c family protein